MGCLASSRGYDAVSWTCGGGKSSDLNSQFTSSKDVLSAPLTPTVVCKCDSADSVFPSRELAFGRFAVLFPSVCISSTHTHTHLPQNCEELY